MRPIYENEYDRSNEGYIKNYIESKSEFTYEKSEPFSSIDGLLFQAGEHVGNVEIKTRTNASGKYPTYMISATKVGSILRMSKEDKVIPLLIVRFTDGVFVVVLEDKYEKRIGGRHDRNDSHDTETCMYIPMTEFVQI
jgi:hypothetical protein|tara:strand:+ start:409 stop:822 length:414 start_codon:yes stop_codon:yes gene_type:complete